MIVELNVPYAEKDKAKSLGARWNQDRKVWYLIDPRDIMPFLRWVPGAQEMLKPIKQALAGTVIKPQKKPKNRHARRRESRRLAAKENHYKPKHNQSFKKTGPDQIESCTCDVYPWEDCEHTSSILT